MIIVHHSSVCLSLAVDKLSKQQSIKLVWQLVYDVCLMFVSIVCFVGHCQAGKSHALAMIISPKPLSKKAYSLSFRSGLLNFANMPWKFRFGELLLLLLFFFFFFFFFLFLLFLLFLLSFCLLLPTLRNNLTVDVQHPKPLDSRFNIIPSLQSYKRKHTLQEFPCSCWWVWRFAPCQLRNKRNETKDKTMNLQSSEVGFTSLTGPIYPLSLVWWNFEVQKIHGFGSIFLWTIAKLDESNVNCCSEWNRLKESLKTEGGRFLKHNWGGRNPGSGAHKKVFGECYGLLCFSGSGEP